MPVNISVDSLSTPIKVDNVDFLTINIIRL
jgi:hypothetical protein